VQEDRKDLSMKRKLVWKMLLLGSTLLTINAWGSKTISFTADLTGNLDIYLMDINRKDPVNLTNHPADDSSPTWAPDGSAFAYVSHRDGNPEIYVMDMNNKESRRLTNNRATDIDPVWSPDGRWIAFASNQHREHAADTDIYIMDVNGKKAQQLTNKGGHNSAPTWSPDGQWIAFRSTLDGIGGIHLMNADGKKQRALTQVSATNPSWAANGKQIYFSSEMLDGVEVPSLFAIDFNGENVRKLVNAAQACEEPAESPDGQWIAYVSTQGNNKDIHLVRVADGEIQQLTQDPGQEFSPAWVPSGLSVSPNTHTRTTLWGTLKQATVGARTHHLQKN
jgi:Tol biopolymer transport system component